MADVRVTPEGYRRVTPSGDVRVVAGTTPPVVTVIVCPPTFGAATVTAPVFGTTLTTATFDPIVIGAPPIPVEVC